MEYILSKKRLVFLGVILIVAIFIVFFWKYKNTDLKNNQDNQEKITLGITNLDSDNDGLKNWEETLWKTDPNNPDTDGDGTGDNEEILNNRNPLVTGPNDLIKTEIEKTTQATTTTKELDPDLSQTDILARTLFSGYLTLKQNNLLGSQQEADFLEQISGQSLDSQTQVKLYTYDDLKTPSDSSKSSIQKYADDFKKIFSNIPQLRDDMVILKEALDNNSSETLNEINQNKIFYKKVLDNLLLITAPLDLLNNHLKLINLFLQMIHSAEQMTTTLKDPVLGLAGSKKYSDVTQEISIIFSEIGKYFKQNNIIY
ncbi:MAG: hypothetical protein V1851_03045 [Patescibacteria group bacterium]